MLIGHADVREISRRPELFSSEPRGPWHVFEYHFSMQAMDGERHTRHRNVVSRAFTPRLVSMLEERAERYADEAIDALAGRRSAEFVRELAVPVPLRIIADMLGIGDGDLELFRSWVDATTAMTSAGAVANSAMQRTIEDFSEYVRRIVAQRTRRPEEDLISAMLAARTRWRSSRSPSSSTKAIPQQAKTSTRMARNAR